MDFKKFRNQNTVGKTHRPHPTNAQTTVRSVFIETGTVVSQIFTEPGKNPSKHKTYIIRTVKEHSFTISGSPICN